jgi:hypothetical protein
MKKSVYVCNVGTDEETPLTLPSMTFEKKERSKSVTKPVDEEDEPLELPKMTFGKE